MQRLDFRDAFKGPWESAIFLTYSFEVVAFERVLWPHLSDSCKTVAVLCDGAHYLSACEVMASRPEQVRHLNVRYACGGVESRNAVHPKAVLLLRKDAGRLLVGSGNVSMQGFTSGGEIFTQFDWASDSSADEDRQPFLAVRELIDNLIDTGQAPRIIQDQLRSTWDSAPWTLRPIEAGTRRVRVVHNRFESFSRQLAEAVGGQEVDELHVMSPFYDEKCASLKRLITQLSPTRVYLYIQEGRTSVDSMRLDDLAAETSASMEFVPCSSSESKRVYLHAKAYVIRTAASDISLVGSPNCSVVAMLRSGADANTELAVLATSPRHELDYLFEGMKLGKPRNRAADLDVALASMDEVPPGPRIPRLLGCAAESGALLLEFDGELEAQPETRILVWGVELTLASCNIDGRIARFELPEGTLKFDRPLLVDVSFKLPGMEEERSQRLFVCNLSALAAQSRRVMALPREVYEDFGDLRISDAEAYRLLTGWLSELLVDARSIKEVVGTAAAAKDVFDDKEVEIAWEDVDFDAYRQDPRVRPYLVRDTQRASEEDSPIEIMLNEVQWTFLGLAGIEPAGITHEGHPDAEAESLAEPEAQSEEEAQQLEAEREAAHLHESARIKNASVRFIRRCLRGFGSAQFRSRVGPYVVTKNTVLFQHFLFLCLRKGWVPKADLMRHSLELWVDLWGGDSAEGSWWSSLDDDMRDAMMPILRSRYADAEFLGLLVVFADTALAEEDWELIRNLQSFWRGFLLRQPLIVDEELLDYSWVVASDLMRGGSNLSPKRVLRILSDLADWTPDSEIPSTLAAMMGQSCLARFESVQVKRPFNGDRRNARENQLSVEGCGGPSVQVVLAKALFSEWMRLQCRDYYRVEFLDHGQNQIAIGVYMPDGPDRFLFQKASGAREELNGLDPAHRPWDAEMARIASLEPTFDAAVRGPRA